MRHKISFELYSYWNGLRGTKTAPTRNSIEPSHIRKILPDLFILERTEDSDVHFRLAGTRICTLFGQEFRGLEFSEAWHEESLYHINKLALDVMKTSAPALISATAIQPDGTLADIEILLLPVASNGSDIDRAIGSIGVMGRTQHSLNEPIGKMSLIGSRLVLSDRTPALGSSKTPDVEPETVTSVRPGGFGQFFQKVLHLRVFEGGRQE